MPNRYLIAVFLLAATSLARSETVNYLGMGELMVPIDWAWSTSSGKPGQFFTTFSGTTYYVRVSEAYESQLISMGTQSQVTATASMAATLGESVSSDMAAAAPEPESAPTVLGPYEIIGVYALDTETDIDRGMDCSNAMAEIVGDAADRIFRIICPITISM